MAPRLAASTTDFYYTFTLYATSNILQLYLATPSMYTPPTVIDDADAIEYYFLQKLQKRSITMSATTT